MPGGNHVDDAEGRIPFRLRIGVTGHRDLLDQEAVAKLVRARLEKLRDHHFPSTATTPVLFTIYSSLAEGADRVVAREAIGVLSEAAELHAILPRSADRYRTDFDTPASRSEFEALLGVAEVVTEMPDRPDPVEGYEMAGRWIVEKSDVLIAVWDGRQPGKRGGTAETVLYARRLGVPLIVVPAERKSRGGAPAEAGANGGNLDLAGPLDAYERVKEFNAASLRAGVLRARHDDDQRRLRELVADSAIHWELESASFWALPRLIRADELAIKWQEWHYRLGASMFLLAALAVTAVAAQIELRLSDKFAFVEVGLMVLALAIYAASRRLDAHERWLGFRSLAEAFRSGLFITLVGSDAPRSTSPRDPDETAEPWFQRAFSESWTQRPQLNPGRETVPELRQFLIEAWVDDQIRYHQGATRRLRDSRNRLNRLVLVLFGLTVVAGVLHAVAFAPFDSSGWRRLFLFLAIALPGFGAALTGIRDQRQFRIHEERSDRTAVRLERLKRDLASQHTVRSLQKLALQVHSVIEAETIEWSGVVEFQELEMVL